jgi:hypothetical protein
MTRVFILRRDWILMQRKKSLRRRRRVKRGMTWMTEVTMKERAPSCKNYGVESLQRKC